jgi:hypothetical protein
MLIHKNGPGGSTPMCPISIATIAAAPTAATPGRGIRDRRVEGSVIDQEIIFGRALDRYGNTVAVARTENQGPENKHIQRPLEQLHWLLG